MDRSSTWLMTRAFLGLGVLVIAMGLLVFVSAGTLRYPQGWAFLGVFFGASLAITLHLMRRDPELLARRVKAGPVAERRPRQRLIQGLANVAFLAVLAVPALDHRFAWSHVPLPVVVAGDVLVGVGFLLVFLVFRENSFASAVVEVGAEQKVIDTGPYARVRHPMYAGALVLLVGVPLALGSLWGLLALVPFTAVIVWRLLDEEAFLARELPGYTAYRSRTRYRLIPFVW
jgi:protein-S-isoprenylcysteine O-methyltransferase Ste14